MKKTLEELKKILQANSQTWGLVAIMALVPNLALAEDGPEEVEEPPLTEEVLPEDWCTPFDGICDEPCYIPETDVLVIDDDCLYEEGVDQEDGTEAEEPLDEPFDEEDFDGIDTEADHDCELDHDTAPEDEWVDEEPLDEEPLDEGSYEDGFAEEPIDEGFEDGSMEGTEDEYFGDDAGMDDGYYEEAYPEDSATHETKHTLDINVNGDFGELGGCSATNPIPLLSCMGLIPWLMRRRRRMLN